MAIFGACYGSQSLIPGANNVAFYLLLMPHHWLRGLDKMHDMLQKIRVRLHSP
jgi:hypothetical protein